MVLLITTGAFIKTEVLLCSLSMGLQEGERGAAAPRGLLRINNMAALLCRYFSFTGIHICVCNKTT